MDTFEIPQALYRDRLGSTDWLVSDPGRFYTTSPIYRVERTGGEVLADVYDPKLDSWSYDVKTGIILTAEQVGVLAEEDDDDD